MNHSVEVEALRILESLLELPEQERSRWLDAQTLEARVAQRVRALLLTSHAAGRFLDMPVQPAEFVLHGAAMPQTGDRLGAWEIVRELDAGGMGVVYLGRRVDGAFEQKVAIKVVRLAGLLPDSERHRQLIERFDNERRLLARLDHPNIVRILDGGSTSAGIPYLVMDHVDGQTLGTYCAAGKLGIEQRLRLLIKICEGVQAAHRHLIVHRDLKPANILVSTDGEPHLLDFGIARLLDDADAQTQTQTAAHVMTPAYASPEQVRCEPLTTASDVYSLGVILFEMLVGERPYALDGASPAQSERIISEAEPVALRKALSASSLDAQDKRLRLAGIGSDLERIVASALHKDPERRYGSAQALADDLQRCLQGRPVHAHPDSLGYRIGKFVRRHRVGVAAAAIALLAILGTGAIALWQADEARRASVDTGLVNAFLVDVLGVSNPYASGSELSLAAALDEAAGKVDERFATRPDLAVDIRYALGRSMLARYRLDQAESQLQRAFDEGTRVFGAEDARTIKALAALASLRKEQNRIAEARTLYDEALARIDRGTLAGSALHASILNDYGVLHLIEDDFARADVLLRKALEIGDRAMPSPSEDERAQTLGNLAHAARGLGNLDRADALYDQVQTIFERIYPDGGPYLAVVLNNRARLARARKDPESSLAYLQRAVAMHRHSFEGDHVMVLVPMTNLARQATDLGRSDLAVEWASRAAAMADRMYANDEHPYHVQALTALADARVLHGQLDEAANAIGRATEALHRLPTPHEASRNYLDAVRARLCAQDASRLPSACNYVPGSSPTLIQ
jgi:serine/threonine-protein kinase